MLLERAAQVPQELPLLRSVMSDLSDTTTLGVYCDWLEEHGDARGTFLRAFLKAFATRKRLPKFPANLPPAWVQCLALPIRRRLREGYEKADPDTLDWAKSKLPKGFAPLEPYFDSMLRSVQYTTRITLGKPMPMSESPLGTSRAGGVPDLPPGMRWPTQKYFDGWWPLQFLLQVNLSDLRGALVEGMLPAEGMLTFFHWPEIGTEDRVFYTPPGTPLQRASAPSPYQWSDWRGDEEFRADLTHPLTLVDAIRFPRTFREVPEELRPWGPGDGVDLCRLLISNWVQERDWAAHWFCTPWNHDICWAGDDFVDSQVPHLELLELSGEDDLQWGFGDGDRLHIFVPTEDASKGNFARIELNEI